MSQFGTLTAVGSTSSGAASGTIALAPTGTIAAGTLLVALTYNAGGPTLSSVADTQGNTWTVVANSNQASVQNVAFAYTVVAVPLTTGDTVTATLSTSAFNRAMIIASSAIPGGFAPVKDKTVANGAAAGTTYTTASTGTLTASDELVIAVFGGSSSAAALSPSSGILGAQFADLVPAVTKVMASGWETVAANTALTASVTWANAATNCAWILQTFRLVATAAPVKSGSSSFLLIICDN